MEANLHNNPNRHPTKYSRALYRVTVNFYKKIRSLQNFVYGKAFLLHWTSSCEKAQPFDKHLVGLGLWTKKEKNISVLLPQTDISRWAYCLFLIPTSTEVCASARKKKTFVPPPHHFQLLTNQHMTHRSVMNDGILCCGSRTIHMKYLWQHSLYILLFVFKHFTKWNLEETLATNRCERDKDKFPLYKHRQCCALWKVEWIQPFCPEKEIARWQDKSHLVFLDFLLFSNKESTHAELLRETALTRTLPDATRSLWW